MQKKEMCPQQTRMSYLGTFFEMILSFLGALLSQCAAYLFTFLLPPYVNQIRNLFLSRCNRYSVKRMFFRLMVLKKLEKCLRNKIYEMHYDVAYKTA